MKNLSIDTLIRWVVIVMLTAIMQCIIMYPLVTLTFEALVLDGLVSGLLLATLCILLKEIVKYGKYDQLPWVQKLINHSALAMLFTLCWVGINILIVNTLFNYGILTIMQPTIPMRIVISLLVYCSASIYYEYTLHKQALCATEDSEDCTDQADTISEKEEMVMEKEEVDNTEIELLEHIAVKNGQKIDLIFINDIIYIQAEGDYVMIHTINGKFLKEETMKYLDQHLPKNKFVRAHRSSIINIDYIQRIELYEKQNQMLKLHNNLQVKMSITGYRELKKVLNL